MARLTWDAIGDRLYEAGIDRGVLYVDSSPGVAWNGLTSVSEEPSGGEAEAYYLDGIKCLNVSTDEEFSGVIEAYTYPDEFLRCEGSPQPYHGLFVTAQPRKSFGLCYRTKIGNDTIGNEYAYKIHLLYNILAAPSHRPNKTLSESADIINFSWKVTAKPPPTPGFKRTSHFVIDSRFIDPITLTAVEDVIYGTDEVAAHLPTPAELFDIFATANSFVVIDHGDGTWTASGTNLEVYMTDPTSFVIDAPGATLISSDTYTLYSP